MKYRNFPFLISKKHLFHENLRLYIHLFKINRKPDLQEAFIPGQDQNSSWKWERNLYRNLYKMYQNRIWFITFYKVCENCISPLFFSLCMWLSQIRAQPPPQCPSNPNLYRLLSSLPLIFISGRILFSLNSSTSPKYIILSFLNALVLPNAPSNGSQAKQAKQNYSLLVEAINIPSSTFFQ